MKKIKIDGMSCLHCCSRVEKALNKLAPTTVDLEKGIAVINTKDNISDQTIKNAVEELGFCVISITEK